MTNQLLRKIIGITAALAIIVGSMVFLGSAVPTTLKDTDNATAQGSASGVETGEGGETGEGVEVREDGGQAHKLYLENYYLRNLLSKPDNSSAYCHCCGRLDCASCKCGDLTSRQDADVDTASVEIQNIYLYCDNGAHSWKIEDVTINRGDGFRCRVSIIPEGYAGDVYWESGDAGIFTVEQIPSDGFEAEVIGVKTGTATLTVTAGDVTATCIIRVIEPH